MPPRYIISAYCFAHGLGTVDIRPDGRWADILPEGPKDLKLWRAAYAKAFSCHITQWNDWGLTEIRCYESLGSVRILPQAAVRAVDAVDGIR